MSIVENIPVVGDASKRLLDASDETLTAILIMIAAFALFAAFSRSPLLKAAVAAWMILP